ncbi:hypothetical protein [Subtercola vilae]|uniref:hypothetical protein n=1 Tax=Subtercola vilae TaxID=2056433 RepID=UPI00191D71BB|nr:hypothetical protein [Subtercola vilae]
MNLVSWENGDTTITDYPACSDRMLSQIVQVVNDRLADSDGRLSAANSIIALDLGHATVGTTAHTLTAVELQVVYVRCAVLAARKVLHLDETGEALGWIEAAERWADDPIDANKPAAAYAYATYSAYASAAYAAYAASATYSATYSASDYKVSLAWEVIDLFKKLTGTESPTPNPEAVATAVTKMFTHA